MKKLSKQHLEEMKAVALAENRAMMQAMMKKDPLHEAAPDMLEALKVCLRRLECVEELGHGLSIQESIKEIIERAEGRGGYHADN